PPEQYTNTGGSEAATTMREALFGSIHQHVIAAIAEGRHISGAAVQDLINKGPYSAGDLAKEPRLVDAVALPEKISELVAAEVGAGIGLGVPQAETADLWQAPQIAVIHIEGDIIDGDSQSLPLLGRKMAGGDTIRTAIAAARFDDRIKAIVLRIDSPGGSALASELISREVFATRGVKPIICSMGDLAASGGYFVAAGCDHIFASATTITGSIGIFFGKFEISGLLAKLGIAVESVHFGDRSEMDSWFRPFTPDERAVLLDKLRYMYGRFVAAVSKGRTLDKTKVDDVGRGHVWTGLQAKERGLVDELGGLAAAMAMARSKAGLSLSEQVQWMHLPVASGGLLRSLLGLSAAGVNEQSALVRLFELLPASLLVAPNAAQTRLPFDIVGN
nr:signal peptide peptidase SppA [Kofleriaceae bacterium]